MTAILTPPAPRVRTAGWLCAAEIAFALNHVLLLVGVLGVARAGATGSGARRRARYRLVGKHARLDGPAAGPESTFTWLGTFLGIIAPGWPWPGSRDLG